MRNELKRRRKRREELHVVEIEERFLSAHADAFTEVNGKKKASACFARNDSFGLGAENSRQDAGATKVAA
jgi:hypothetical protein